MLAYHLATSSDPVAAFQRYEDARLEATSRIVLGNRAQGPDKVLELARQRAPIPTIDIDAVLPFEERSNIAESYKKLAGFSPSALNDRRSYSVQSAA